MNRPVATVPDKSAHARALCERRAWGRLLEFSHQWHAEEPADYKALYYTGLGYSGLNQFSLAETAYRRALAMNASDFRVWNNLAGILFDVMNRPAEGIACLEKALAVDPQNKVGWSNLANLAGRLGKHDQALECAQRALALDPHMVEAQLHRARAAQALGKTEILRSANETLATLPPERFPRTH